MTAVVKATAGPGAVLDQVAIPEPKGKDVLIEVAASSICGTDVHIFDWNDWARRHIHPPRVFGHEMSGRIVATGSEVKDLKPGTFVAAETPGRLRPAVPVPAVGVQPPHHLGVVGQAVLGAGERRRTPLVCWFQVAEVTPKILAVRRDVGYVESATTVNGAVDRGGQPTPLHECPDPDARRNPLNS